MDRRETIRSLFDANGCILEIGPSHQPVFAKSAGYNVEILDHASAEDLRLKYVGLDLNLDEIEQVDYISDGRPLHEVIPHRSRYDLIFSSHVIEHTTDFLGYLKSCELLLKTGGVIGLAVPDKRYTFDILQQVSTTGQVLQAHHLRQVRHSPSAVYDFMANFAHLDNMPSWSSGDSGSVTLMNESVTPAKALFDDATLPGSRYHDVHGWIFTPSSFRLIMHDLAALGLTQVRERRLVQPGVMEFFVVMNVGGDDNGLSRIDIQKALIHEQVVSGLQILAAEDQSMASARVALSDPSIP